MRAAERAAELVSRLRVDPRVRRLLEMTGNPLFLANICLVHRDRGTLPRGRARLCDECIDVLLERWSEGKGLAVGVGADTARRVLQPAALWLHGENRRTRATETTLAPVLENVHAGVGSPSVPRYARRHEWLLPLRHPSIPVPLPAFVVTAGTVCRQRRLRTSPRASS